MEQIEGRLFDPSPRNHHSCHDLKDDVEKCLRNDDNNPYHDGTTGRVGDLGVGPIDGSSGGGLTTEQTSSWVISTFQTGYDAGDGAGEERLDLGRTPRSKWNLLHRRRKRRRPSSLTTMGKPSLRRSDSMNSVAGASVVSVVTARGTHFRCMSVSLFLILLVGIAASTTILWVGIQSVQDTQMGEFQGCVDEIADKLQQFLVNTELLGLWTHQACAEVLLERGRRAEQLPQPAGSNGTEDPHRKFRRFWDYVQQASFVEPSVGCAVNATHDERPALENETIAFLASLPPLDLSVPSAAHLFFQENNQSVAPVGFKDIVNNPDTGRPVAVSRSVQPFYFPLQYVEPVEVPEGRFALDLDLYAQDKVAIDLAISTGMPTTAARIPEMFLYDVFSQENKGDDDDDDCSNQNHVVTEAPDDVPAYAVTLLHPGPIQSDVEATRHISAIPVSINALLRRCFQSLRMLDLTIKVLVFGPSHQNDDASSPEFLGGAIFHHDDNVRQEGVAIEYISEISYDDAIHEANSNSDMPRRYHSVQPLRIASSEWTLILSSASGKNQQDQRQQVVFIALGAATILVATIFLSLLIYTNARRIRNISRMKSSAEAEKAALRLENARQAAQHERDLNDFIAHEVRNPLNAALSANTFVSASVNEERPLLTEEVRQSVREDVQIIDSSLQFINDLLRNMLDVHRAASQQLNIDWAYVDLLHDVLEPVKSMIYRRGANFDVIVDCPTSASSSLIVETDPLRLKQIMLNLGRNAAKFVDKGFIRFRCQVIDGSVCLYVEDSGPGVPLKKRNNLFGRFQETLDTLNQGTGIGLNLCKNLAELLRAELWLDESYNSGIPGSPGSCFVLNLRTPPIEDSDSDIENAIIDKSLQYSSGLDLRRGTTSVTPITETAGPTSKGPASVARVSSSKKLDDRELPIGVSILFVDDDFTLRKLFVRAVKRVTTDWEIHEASNGETAVRKDEIVAGSILYSWFCLLFSISHSFPYHAAL